MQVVEAFTRYAELALDDRLPTAMARRDDFGEPLFWVYFGPA